MSEPIQKKSKIWNDYTLGGELVATLYFNWATLKYEYYRARPLIDRKVQR